MNEMNYTTCARCTNCGWTGQVSQMKGRSLGELYCPQCACQQTLVATSSGCSCGCTSEGTTKNKELIKG